MEGPKATEKTGQRVNGSEKASGTRKPGRPLIHVMLGPPRYIPSYHIPAEDLWREALAIFFLAAVVVIIAFNGQQRMPDWLVSDGTYYDVWFDGDCPRVVQQAVNRLSDPRDRTIMHPLYSLMAFPLTGLLSAALVIKPLTALRLAISLAAGLWTGLLFLLFRLIGCRRFDAVLFTVLGAVSASAMFWFSVPESWVFSSVTVLVPLLLLVVAERRTIPVRWYILMSAATLSMTLSNWMLGLFIAFEKFNWRRALWISLSAFGAVAMLCGVSALVFPTYKIAFPEYAHEYIFQQESGGPLHVLISFFLHTLVMPMFQIVSGWDHPGVLRMTTQVMPAGSATLWGGVAVALWVALLGFGFLSAWAIKRHPALLRMMVAWLLWQISLHLIYGGQETFLYSLHWLPCLLAFAAYGSLTRLRRPVLVVTAALILCAGINNRWQFNNAVAFVQHRELVHGDFSSILPAPTKPATPAPHAAVTRRAPRAKSRPAR